MSYLINNQQKLNDIVFANRNKNYGAYAIRSSYGETMLKSLSLMAFGSLAIVYTVSYFLYKPIPEISDVLDTPAINDSIYVIPINLTPEKKNILDKNNVRHSSPAPKTNVNSPALVIKDSVQMATTLTSEPNFTAATTSTLAIAGSNDLGKIGDVDKKNGDETGSSTKLLYEVDSEPEYEGGLPAITRFVKANVRYPEIAIGEGKAGTVFVKFVVDETGKVTNLSLLNSLGYGLDDEAIRVVGLLPKFKKPGMVKGKPVKVYYQLPIRFSLR